jgi:lambda repressor-like predicted transcriptional regulator
VLLKVAGVFSRDNSTTHGKSYTSEYDIWAGMIQRCSNPNNCNYPDYGGKGIRVCVRWDNSFEAFYADMGPRPSSEHSLDRYPDYNGHYMPSNCRWATRTEQNNNRSDNVFYNYKGETYSIKQLSIVFNINEDTLATRLRRGLSVDEAISRPIGAHSKDTLTQLAKDVGINYKTLTTRLRRGYSIEDAVNKNIKEKS